MPKYILIYLSLQSLCEYFYGTNVLFIISLNILPSYFYQKLIIYWNIWPYIAVNIWVIDNLDYFVVRFLGLFNVKYRFAHVEEMQDLWQYSTCSALLREMFLRYHYNLEKWYFKMISPSRLMIVKCVP